MEKPIGQRFFKDEKLIEVMEQNDPCLGCCCPPGECYDWNMKVSECMKNRRCDGKSIVFHQVPIWWGERKV